MKAAKKRYHMKIPKFWNILKTEHSSRPLKDEMIMISFGYSWLDPKEIVITSSGRSIGKSRFKWHKGEI